MPDWEKVVKGLEEAHDVIAKHVPVRYWGYSTFACTDAIALLKAQEPVVPIRTTQHAQGADEVWFECGECYAFLGVDWGRVKACPKCGRTVKW